MRKLSAFVHTSLDGYFAGPNGDISWAHPRGPDPEFNGFVAENVKGDGELLFGRVTYEMMASYWPSPLAAQNDPAVAQRMNQARKLVVSRSLERADWAGTQIIKGDLAAEVEKLKAEPGEPIVILGSGSIISQLAAAGLIDEFQVVISPIILGRGQRLFEMQPEYLPLKLIRSRTFANGKVFLVYEPAR